VSSAALPASELDPDAIATAVLACPEVAGLSGGLVGEVATYLPGRRVTGVRVATSGVEVSVVGRYGLTVAEIAAAVRDAVGRVAGSGPVDVVIADLAVPPGTKGEQPLMSSL